MATVHLPTPVTVDKIISAALWTAQVVLASVFAVDGIINLTAPLVHIADGTPWLAAMPPPLVRVLGALEILGAVSLMLPTSARALTRTAGSAAAIFALLTLLDLATRAPGASASALVLESALLVVTALVAWERLRAHRDEPR